jgi:hypothetical protein
MLIAKPKLTIPILFCALFCSLLMVTPSAGASPDVSAPVLHDVWVDPTTVDAGEN